MVGKFSNCLLAITLNILYLFLIFYYLGPFELFIMVIIILVMVLVNTRIIAFFISSFIILGQL